MTKPTKSPNYMKPLTKTFIVVFACVAAIGCATVKATLQDSITTGGK